MEKVRIVQDESSHWYIIPNKKLEDFYEDSVNIEMCDNGNFDRKWAQYATGGSPNNIQLYANLEVYFSM